MPTSFLWEIPLWFLQQKPLLIKLVSPQQPVNVQHFHQRKYLSNIRHAPYGKYLRVHCNSGVTFINNIGDLPGYSNPVLYNPKDIANILSLGLVQKHHLVTYTSQYGNEFIVHSPQRPPFKITKANIFQHYMSHHIKNKKTLTPW